MPYRFKDGGAVVGRVPSYLRLSGAVEWVDEAAAKDPPPVAADDKSAAQPDKTPAEVVFTPDPAIETKPEPKKASPNPAAKKAARPKRATSQTSRKDGGK